MKKINEYLNKFYCFNLLLVALVILSILTMFFVQFKVENLQEQMAKDRQQISDFEDQIRLLEVEWVYLTRPERLRQISAKYLKNNGYALANQIKGEDDIERIYSTNYQEEFAPDDKVGDTKNYSF